MHKKMHRSLLGPEVAVLQFGSRMSLKGFTRSQASLQKMIESWWCYTHNCNNLLMSSTAESAFESGGLVEEAGHWGWVYLPFFLFLSLFPVHQDVNTFPLLCPLPCRGTLIWNRPIMHCSCQPK